DVRKAGELENRTSSRTSDETAVFHRADGYASRRVLCSDFVRDRHVLGGVHLDHVLLCMAGCLIDSKSRVACFAEAYAYFALSIACDESHRECEAAST